MTNYKLWISRSLKLVAAMMMAFSLSACWESDTENAAEDVGEQIEETADDVGDGIEDAAESTEDAAEDAMDHDH